MKKLLILCAFLFICVSTALADHPLIGKWKFREKIGYRTFEDYVTISAVNRKTKRVVGHLWGQGFQASSADTTGWLPVHKLTGYYNGNIVFLMDNAADGYMDGYYFDFQGTTPLSLHLGVCSADHNFDSEWHPMKVTKLSDDISPDPVPPPDIFNQKMLKKQAQLAVRFRACNSSAMPQTWLCRPR